MVFLGPSAYLSIFHPTNFTPFFEQFAWPTHGGQIPVKLIVGPGWITISENSEDLTLFCLFLEFCERFKVQQTAISQLLIFHLFLICRFY